MFKCSIIRFFRLTINKLICTCKCLIIINTKTWYGICFYNFILRLIVHLILIQKF
jgi:hypothetical protein